MVNILLVHLLATRYTRPPMKYIFIVVGRALGNYIMDIHVVSVGFYLTVKVIGYTTFNLHCLVKPAGDI